MCKYLVLISLDLSREFVVQTDALSVGLGAVRSKVVIEGKHPVVFLRRKLATAERNYSVVRLEYLTIK